MTKKQPTNDQNLEHQLKKTNNDEQITKQWQNFLDQSLEIDKKRKNTKTNEHNLKNHKKQPKCDQKMTKQRPKNNQNMTGLSFPL